MKRERKYSKVTPIRWVQQDYERLNEEAYKARKPFSVHVRDIVLEKCRLA